MPLRVWLGFASFLWRDGERQQALHCVRSFLDAHGGIEGGPAAVTEVDISASILGEQLISSTTAMGWLRTTLSPDDAPLVSKAWLQLGEWQRHVTVETLPPPSPLRNGGSSNVPHELSTALRHYGAATQLHPSSYKAWHSLAQVHFEVVQTATQELQARESGEGGDDGEDSQGTAVAASAIASTADPNAATSISSAWKAHVVPAIECFFRSITLGAAQGRALQDILRLLTLWFQHSREADIDVNGAIVRGLQRTPIDTWLSVIPQLIARIHNPVKATRDAVCDLLVRLGMAHPQGLCFPLTVASHSSVEMQKAGAQHVLDNMRRTFDTLVQQAHLVASELIRTAALWSEQWQDALTEACSMYVSRDDISGMIATLEPYHRMACGPPQTLAEVTFQQIFGRQLDQAWRWVQRYQQSGARSDLDAAWVIYKQSYDRIVAKNRAMSKLELPLVSPALHLARDLELAVPGTYMPKAPFATISSFTKRMDVIVSKQRPRKLSLVGDDERASSCIVELPTRFAIR